MIGTTNGGRSVDLDFSLCDDFDKEKFEIIEAKRKI